MQVRIDATIRSPRSDGKSLLILRIVDHRARDASGCRTHQRLHDGVLLLRSLCVAEPGGSSAGPVAMPITSTAPASGASSIAFFPIPPAGCINRPRQLSKSCAKRTAALLWPEPSMLQRVITTRPGRRRPMTPTRSLRQPSARRMPAIPARSARTPPFAWAPLLNHPGGRDRHSGAPRRLALGALPHAGRRALGVTWILDGLEVTLAGALVRRPQGERHPRVEQCRNRHCRQRLFWAAVLGALFFGWLTDRLGRKKLFFITHRGSISPRPRRPRCRGTSGRSRFFGS